MNDTTTEIVLFYHLRTFFVPFISTPGAQKVRDNFDGMIPETVTELRSIDGVGPYTAGAIASIAFNKVEPLVDGNVIRVLSRLFALKEIVGENYCFPVKVLVQ